MRTCASCGVCKFVRAYCVCICLRIFPTLHSVHTYHQTWKLIQVYLIKCKRRNRIATVAFEKQRRTIFDKKKIGKLNQSDLSIRLKKKESCIWKSRSLCWSNSVFFPCNLSSICKRTKKKLYKAHEAYKSFNQISFGLIKFYCKKKRVKKKNGITKTSSNFINSTK